MSPACLTCFTPKNDCDASLFVAVSDNCTLKTFSRHRCDVCTASRRPTQRDKFSALAFPFTRRSRQYRFSLGHYRPRPRQVVQISRETSGVVHQIIQAGAALIRSLTDLEVRAQHCHTKYMRTLPCEEHNFVVDCFSEKTS